MLITNGESKSLIVRNAASAIWGNGIACLCLAALLFAVAAALVKTMASTGVPTFQIVCIRSGCCLLISYFSAKAGGIPFLYGSTKNYPLLAVRGTIGAAAMSGNYMCVPALSVPIQTTSLPSPPSFLFCYSEITACRFNDNHVFKPCNYCHSWMDISERTLRISHFNWMLGSLSRGIISSTTSLHHRPVDTSNGISRMDKGAGHWHVFSNYWSNIIVCCIHFD